MPRYYPPEKTPIDKVLEIARKIRVLADKIDASSKGIAATEFNEPWIFYTKNAERGLELLQGYSNALFAQQTKMEMGDPGGPSTPPEVELSESTKKTLKLAKKALRSKNKPPDKKHP